MLGHIGSFLGAELGVRLDSTSRMVLIAPSQTFGSSYPKGRRQTHPVSDLEELAIPVLNTKPIEVDVRSPWFRNELLAGLADITALGIVKLLLGACFALLIAIFNDEIKDLIKRRLRRNKKRSTASEPE